LHFFTPFIQTNSRLAVTTVTIPRKGILASIPFLGLALRWPIHVIRASDFEIIGGQAQGIAKDNILYHSTLTNAICQPWLSLMLMMIG
jgi:hypothetical protein